MYVCVYISILYVTTKPQIYIYNLKTLFVIAITNIQMETVILTKKKTAFLAFSRKTLFILID